MLCWKSNISWLLGLVSGNTLLLLVTSFCCGTSCLLSNWTSLVVLSSSFIESPFSLYEARSSSCFLIRSKALVSAASLLGGTISRVLPVSIPLLCLSFACSYVSLGSSTGCSLSRLQISLLSSCSEDVVLFCELGFWLTFWFSI